MPLHLPPQTLRTPARAPARPGAGAPSGRRRAYRAGGPSNVGTADDRQVVRFGLDAAFLRKMRRVGDHLRTLQGAQPVGPPLGARSEALAFRRRDLAPFFAVLDPATVAPETPRLWWTPHEAAATLLRGDLAFLRGDIQMAQRRWWAADHVAARRSSDWQERLFRTLHLRAVDPTLPAPLRALARLHHEASRHIRIPGRWLGPEHEAVLWDVLALDPLAFLARFMLSAVAYTRGDLDESDALFARAAIDMQGCAQGALSAIPWGRGGDADAARNDLWQWLAHAWPKEPAFAYIAANGAILAGDLRGALAHAQDVLGHRLVSALPMQLLAQVRTGLGDYEGAAEAWAKSLPLGPDLVFTHRQLGVAFVRLGQTATAERHLALAVESAPDRLEAECGNGVALMGIHAYPAALRAFDRALAQGPTHCTALANRGIILRLMGRPRDALEPLLKARAYCEAGNVNFSFGALILGQAYADLNCDDAAVQAFDEACADALHPFEVHLAAGQALAQLAAHAAARVHFQAACALAPGVPAPAIELAHTYLHEGQGALALPLLTEASEILGRTGSLCHSMAAAHAQMGAIDEAERLYLEAATSQLGDAQAMASYQTMVACVRMLLERGLARRALSRALAFLRLSDDIELHDLCALAAYQCGQMSLACTHAIACVVRAPDRVDAWNLLLALPRGTSVRTDDLACLMRSGERSPRDYLLQSRLARVAGQAGAHEMAVRVARTAAALRPESEAARHQLVVALFHAQTDPQACGNLSLMDVEAPLDSDLDVAECLREAENLPEAERALKALLTADPHNRFARGLLLEVTARLHPL